MGKVIDYINNLSLDEEYQRIFGKSIPQGKFFCPFHNNVNTPSAKKYGNVIHCFGACGRSYGVYDLLKKFDPARIEEIKSSIIIPDSNQSKHKRVQMKIIDRSLPISKIIKIICNEESSAV